MNENLERLKKLIKEKVIVTKETRQIVSKRGSGSSFLFDFRTVCLSPDALDLIAEIFWQRFEKEYPFQVAGQETAAIPLVAAIVMKSKEKKWEFYMPGYVHSTPAYDALNKTVLIGNGNQGKEGGIYCLEILSFPPFFITDLLLF